MAWFWELLLRYLYIETDTLEANLSYKERVDLVQKFNDRDSTLKVLIIMYNVGAQGTNLDEACCRVLISTAAINAASEIQAYGRVIRVRCYPRQY